MGGIEQKIAKFREQFNRMRASLTGSDIDNEINWLVTGRRPTLPKSTKPKGRR